MTTKVWYQMKEDEVLQHVKSDRKSGLQTKTVTNRLEKVGLNQLQQQQGTSVFSLLLQQFRDVMVIILLVATLISGLLGEYMDGLAIIAIIILNAFLGFFQEYRAERSLKVLSQLAAPQSHVIREGRRLLIPAEQLVPGDIVLLHDGDRVPADLRLLETHSLHIDEATLTGESLPVRKSIDAIMKSNLSLGDQENMAFMGTSVTRGRGVGVVIGTGMDTEIGQIAHLLQSAERASTPLQIRLEQLGKLLIVLAIFLTMVVVGLGVLNGEPLYQMLLAGVSLAVAAIPEGLPAIVTIVLALGVQRMIRRRAIVRKLPSVETLGCTTVICSDKTGTLTQNKMEVVQLLSGRRRIDVSGNGYQPVGAFTENSTPVNVAKILELQRLLEIAALCNQAQLLCNGDGSHPAHWRVDGDPTEGALLVMANKGGVDAAYLEKNWRLMGELPFDSERKRMSVLVENGKNEAFLFCKGAPDLIIQRCEWQLLEGRLERLSAGERARILAVNEEMARSALRNLAFAYRPMPLGGGNKLDEHMEEGLIFVGMTGMIDPPRPEVAQSIKKCHEAGIRTVMITGDHLLTAVAIATQLGMLPPKGKVLDGSQLDQLNDDELADQIEEIQLFARVSPQHKLRIVKAFQANGHVVAMTGDGVNDAPAIKQADIGVAMGKGGTDVAKEASDLILADDNFATIEAAIEEGRNIYDNIRKFIRYLLASNVGEILVMFLAMLAGFPLPLVPIQILWINLVTDGLPALALGVDQPEEETMLRPPRHHGENFFSRGLGSKIVSRGLAIGIVSILAFNWAYKGNMEQLAYAQTVTFATLVVAQLIHVFDCRSERSVFARPLLQNRLLVGAVLLSFFMLVCVIEIEALQPIFHTVSLTLRDWTVIGMLAVMPTILFGMGGLLQQRQLRMAR